MIFDRIERNDSSAKLERETDFEYLNRSSALDVSDVREFLEREVNAYPESDRDELIARLKSRRKSDFKSASFELLLYGLLTRRGFHLVPHPDLNNGTGRRPDFLVTAPSEEQFYLEAVLTSDSERGGRGLNRMIEIALDVVDRRPHPNFWVHMSSSGVPATQPAGTRLARDIHAWLDGLDADAMLAYAAVDGLRLNAEPLEWRHEDWVGTFQAIPVSREHRGRTERLIGMRNLGARWVNNIEPIKSAVRHKGQHYGEITRPLIVAVNVDSFALAAHEESSALFGTEAMAISGDKVRAVRRPDGVWHNGAEPTARRVSGVWLFNDLEVYSVAGRRSTLYFNPWANHPLGDSLKWLPHAVVDNGTLLRSQGARLRDVFELSADWPLG